MHAPVRLLFWMLLLVLGTTAVHATLLLFLPRHSMNGIMEAVARAGGTNRLVVLERTDWSRIEIRPDPAMLHAACLLEPKGGRIRLEAAIPDAYWSITVHAPNGTVIYALDDRFASRQRVVFVFEPAAAALEPGKLVTPELGEREIRVPLDVQRALAVIRVHAPWPGMKARLMEAFRASRCRRLPSAGEAGQPVATAEKEGRPADMSLPLPRPRPVRD